MTWNAEGSGNQSYLHRIYIVTLERTEEWPSTWCRTDWPASSQGRTGMWVTWHRTAHTDRAEASMRIPVPHSVLLFRTQCCCSTLTYWAQSQKLAAQREAEALAPWIFPSWTGERARKGYWERCKVRKQWMLGGGIKTHECTHRMVFKREEKLTKLLETQYSICRTDSSIERTLR